MPEFQMNSLTAKISHVLRDFWQISGFCEVEKMAATLKSSFFAETKDSAARVTTFLRVSA